MLGQILTEAMSHIQLITAGLLFTVAVLELIHIGQTSRINRKLSRAGRWLQRYLNTVFREETEDEPDRTETERRTSPEKKEQAEEQEETEVQLEAAQLLKSRQEENMRVSLAHKKNKKDEELLHSVLQEIFN